MAEEVITASFLTNIDIAEEVMTSHIQQTRVWLKTTSMQVIRNTEDIIACSLNENMDVTEDMITASLHKFVDIADEVYKAGLHKS